MEKKLTRSDNKIFAGICAGIAEYFGIDVTLTRAAWAVLTLCTCFCGVILYIILLFIMPKG